MGLFKRLRDISMAQINALLDKAEDPVKMLDQYLRDMEEDIADAETGVAKQIALEKKLQAQLNEAREMAAKREGQAVQALEQGRDDLARRALEDKKRFQQQVDGLQGQWQAAAASAGELRQKLNEMKQEYESLRSRKQVLEARAEAAKAQKKINEAFSGIGGGAARDGFDKMEAKVLQLEAEAEASEELRDDKDDLDREMAALGNGDVDAELEALKASLRQQKGEA